MTLPCIIKKKQTVLILRGEVTVFTLCILYVYIIIIILICLQSLKQRGQSEEAEPEQVILLQKNVPALLLLPVH